MVAGPPFVVPVAVPRTVRINESFPGPPPGAGVVPTSMLRAPLVFSSRFPFTYLLSSHIHPRFFLQWLLYFLLQKEFTGRVRSYIGTLRDFALF